MSRVDQESTRPRRADRPSIHWARPAPERVQPRPGSGKLLLGIGGALIAAGLVGAAMPRRNGRSPSAGAARIAGYGAGLVAASVLADSALEHYRGNFKNPVMYMAPTMAAATLAAALSQSFSPTAERTRAAVFGAAVLVGAVGTGFHLRNITMRPGGLTFNNLFYRAPFGAPAALALAGAFGLGSLMADEGGEFGLGDRAAGRGLGAATAAGLFGLAAEIGLLHFRGAFHDPLMYAPVAAVPLTGAAMLAVLADPTASRRKVARRLLGTTTALGAVGTGLHAYGVSRNMGGFGNWTQNLFQGPPVAAPPSLAGIALAGFAALRLLAEDTTRRTP
ncbi:MAG TPA: hypothetical protein VFJ13_09540 [Paracoccaceae bacterium]|nr:hypothetical protein [Paracoccaceae bacterium]